MQLYLTCENLIELLALKNEATDAYVNDAVVTALVRDAADTTTIATVTLSYVASSNGAYRGTLDDSVALVRGTRYILRITATSGSNKLTWQDNVVADWYRGR